MRLHGAGQRATDVGAQLIVVGTRVVDALGELLHGSTMQGLTPAHGRARRRGSTCRPGDGAVTRRSSSSSPTLRYERVDAGRLDTLDNPCATPVDPFLSIPPASGVPQGSSPLARTLDARNLTDVPGDSGHLTLPGGGAAAASCRYERSNSEIGGPSRRRLGGPRRRRQRVDERRHESEPRQRIAPHRLL